MANVEANTNSKVKVTVGQRQWKIYSAPETLLESSQKREDDWYKDHSERYGYRDGLTIPYFVDHEEQRLPLPLVLSLEKDNEARKFYAENPSLKPDVPNWSNDSVFATGDKNGRLLMAINKTDPNRNHGDVGRLSSFFHAAAASGLYLYSVGYNIIEGQITSASINLGRLQRLSHKRLREILREHLPRTGAFDIGFILSEGFVEPSERFIATESIVEIEDEKYKEYLVGTRSIDAKTASYSDLQMLGHGLHLPEEY